MRRLVLACALLGMGAASANEICYSPVTPLLSMAPATSSTLFACPGAGSHTINQLAQAGWSIVKLSPIVVGGSPLDPMGAHQLLIRRGQRIFASGFD